MKDRRRGLVLGSVGVVASCVATLSFAPSGIEAAAPPPTPLDVHNPGCVVAIQPGESLA